VTEPLLRFDRFALGNRHVTESFDIKEGAWVPRRTYVWVLEPGEGTIVTRGRIPSSRQRTGIQ